MGEVTVLSITELVEINNLKNPSERSKRLREFSSSEKSELVKNLLDENNAHRFLDAAYFVLNFSSYARDKIVQNEELCKLVGIEYKNPTKNSEEETKPKKLERLKGFILGKEDKKENTPRRQVDDYTFYSKIIGENIQKIKGFERDLKEKVAIKLQELEKEQYSSLEEAISISKRLKGFGYNSEKVDSYISQEQSKQMAEKEKPKIEYKTNKEYSLLTKKIENLITKILNEDVSRKEKEEYKSTSRKYSAELKNYKDSIENKDEYLKFETALSLVPDFLDRLAQFKHNFPKLAIDVDSLKTNLKSYLEEGKPIGASYSTVKHGVDDFEKYSQSPPKFEDSLLVDFLKEKIPGTASSYYREVLEGYQKKVNETYDSSKRVIFDYSDIWAHDKNLLDGKNLEMLIRNANWLERADILKSEIENTPQNYSGIGEAAKTAAEILLDLEKIWKEDILDKEVEQSKFYGLSDNYFEWYQKLDYSNIIEIDDNVPYFSEILKDKLDYINKAREDYAHSLQRDFIRKFEAFGFWIDSELVNYEIDDEDEIELSTLVSDRKSLQSQIEIYDKAVKVLGNNIPSENKETYDEIKKRYSNVITLIENKINDKKSNYASEVSNEISILKEELSSALYSLDEHKETIEGFIELAQNFEIKGETLEVSSTELAKINKDIDLIINSDEFNQWYRAYGEMATYWVPLARDNNDIHSLRKNYQFLTKAMIEKKNATKYKSNGLPFDNMKSNTLKGWEKEIKIEEDSYVSSLSDATIAYLTNNLADKSSPEEKKAFLIEFRQKVGSMLGFTPEVLNEFGKKRQDVTGIEGVYFVRENGGFRGWNGWVNFYKAIFIVGNEVQDNEIEQYEPLYPTPLKLSGLKRPDLKGMILQSFRKERFDSNEGETKKFIEIPDNSQLRDLFYSGTGSGRYIKLDSKSAEFINNKLIELGNPLL